MLAAAMLAPAAALSLGPIVYALRLEAWFSVSDAGPGSDGTFVGLANFQFLAGDDSFWQMVGNTRVYTGVGTVLKLRGLDIDRYAAASEWCTPTW